MEISHSRPDPNPSKCENDQTGSLDLHHERSGKEEGAASGDPTILPSWQRKHAVRERDYRRYFGKQPENKRSGTAINYGTVHVDPSSDMAQGTRAQFCESGAFYSFRNSVLAVLRGFGTVGPLGDRPMKSPATIDHDSTWPVEEINPTFFVVNEQDFPEDNFVHVEVEAKHIATGLLAALTEFVETYPGWQVRLAVYRVGHGIGQLLLSADKVVIEGQMFTSCSNTIEIVRACQE